MLDKMIELLKEKPIIAPSKLFYNYKKLNINEQDLLVLIFLINASDETFNPTEISTNMDMKLNEVMTSINNLITQNLIEIETIKEKKIREIIKLDKMYEKLALIINEETKEENTDIYTTFEKEFGRTLAPSELSVIKEFKEHYNEEIIQLALKEAIFNGVKNLRYIDSILKNWSSAGIKTKEELNNYQKKFKQEKERKPEIIDYDWLNES